MIEIETYYQFHETLEFIHLYLEGRPLHFKGEWSKGHPTTFSKKGNIISIHETGRNTIQLTFSNNTHHVISEVVTHLETAHEIQNIIQL